MVTRPARSPDPIATAELAEEYRETFGVTDAMFAQPWSADYAPSNVELTPEELTADEQFADRSRVSPDLAAAVLLSSILGLGILAFGAFSMLKGWWA